MDPIATYRESSPFLRRKLELFPEQVVIEGYQLQSGSFRAVVDLNSVSPNYGFFHHNRADRFLGLFFLIPLAAVFYLIKFEFQLPISNPQCIATLVFAGIAAAYSFIQMSRKILVYRFSNMDNAAVLDIFRSGVEKDECLEFVEKVKSAIQTLAKKDSSDTIQDQIKDNP